MIDICTTGVASDNLRIIPWYNLIEILMLYINYIPSVECVIHIILRQCGAMMKLDTGRQTFICKANIR